MEDTKAKLANRLKEANNVLVSVTTSPSVDQFAAAIAMTLILNKLGKHATTVFSGTIPSTVEFLQPEKVVETNTDSLRDFIISLDKSKADKLRYKIEDNFVKIFITPYHASIGEKDLVFSQGDFNVDVVLGLGVHQREELDQAITAHGRILHDATVMSINTQAPSNLGSINWSDSKSSSLCEMIVYLSDLLAKQGLFDTQISNALLTGIVAETQRFSNQKTTSSTMSASSKLLASGANQQLVATQLTPKSPLVEPAKPAPPAPKDDAPIPEPVTKDPETDKEAGKKNPDGEIKIEHEKPQSLEEIEELNEKSLTQVLIDDQGTLKKVEKDDAQPSSSQPSDELPKVEPPPPEEPADSPPPPPQPIVPPPPEYVPPPLIPLPPDSAAPADDAPDNKTASDMPSPPAPSVDGTNQTGGAINNPSGSYLSGPKLVLEPPSMTGQLNANENGVTDEEGFPDPLDPSQPGPSGSVPSPMLSHNSGPASLTPPAGQTNQAASNLPNLDEVRSAVNSALSTNAPDISNQPLASLNAQPVNLNLNQNTPPPPFSPQNQSPQNVGPTLTPPPATAPPVPPPIIPLNDNNLPPSFTAL